MSTGWKKSGKPPFTLGSTSHEETTSVLRKTRNLDGSRTFINRAFCKVGKIERKRETERERERVMHSQVPDDAHAGDKYRGVNASRCRYTANTRERRPVGKGRGGEGRKGEREGGGEKSAKNLNLKVRWHRDSPPYKSLLRFYRPIPLRPLSRRRHRRRWYLVYAPISREKKCLAKLAGSTEALDKTAPTKAHYRDNEIEQTRNAEYLLRSLSHSTR